MGQILSSATTHVITPSLQYYDKLALEHIAEFADDFTGEMIDTNGQLRRGCLGLITYIPEDKFEYPSWRDQAYPLRERIGSLVLKGWVKRIEGEELDGALLLNTSRLVRMMDCQETLFATNQHLIQYEDECGNDIVPPCLEYSDPLFKPFLHFADRLFPGDFSSTLLDDVSLSSAMIEDACLEVERDRAWKELNPGRWARAIADWKSYLDGTRLPAQWQVPEIVGEVGGNDR